jgi:pimeloyl-ACP methyl ester carboxylesterase/DNA-binding SARP family transcriptional activator
VKKTIQTQLIGDVRLFSESQTLELPKSKKTRALLGYLIVSNRPIRRERLCEVFWESSNDPKGALRWSLSQLRKVEEQAGVGFIEADRERVSIRSDILLSDLAELYTASQNENWPEEDIDPFLDMAKEDLLGGLDLPNLGDYTVWLRTAREKASEMYISVIRAQLRNDTLNPEKQITLAKTWLDIRPFESEAALALLHHLETANRLEDVEDWQTTLTKRFKEAGIEFDPHTPSQVISKEVLTEEQTLLYKQKISFCKTPDGNTLAYATTGDGPPLFKAANWLTHLELDWSAPIWSPIFKELSRDFKFIRYDERGNGLSDWDVKELSQKTFVQDLETIIEQFDYQTFPLLGISQGVAVCIDYAIANPERVSKLVLFGGYPKGWRIDATPEVTASREAMITLTRSGWGQENPAYRNVFSSTFMPTATPEQLNWFNDFQKQTTSPDNAVRFLEAFADIDVREKLSQISVPTLVVHSRGDQRIDWTVGRDMASEIPNAQFVILESDNHLLLDGEAASLEFTKIVREFLRD